MRGARALPLFILETGKPMAHTLDDKRPVFDHSATPNAGRMPAWIRQRLGGEAQYGLTAGAVRQHALHTVCEEARCPNRAECWSRGTATFMLLGDTCTRACGFCAVKTGKPSWFDAGEPRRVADAVLGMGLDYVVLTSVNRDDLADGGAGIFAATLLELARRKPGIGLEVLTPDFHACQDKAVALFDAALHEADTRMVWGHNVETVPVLYKTVRKGSDYQRSLQLLAKAARLPRVEAKSALMLGLGETRAEVLAVLRDLRDAGVQRVSLGQYLRPSRYHLPVKEYITPAQFSDYEAAARALGFAWVKAGALVRSSYHAEEEQTGQADEGDHG